MNRHWTFLLAALAASAGIAPAGAQSYPTKPIHLVAPYAPGGIADIAARLVGQKLTEALGQQVVVENRPGGNGFIGVMAVTRAAPDGYTLLVATAGDVTINPALFKDMPYDVDRDLVPITMLSDTPTVLAAHGEAPYKTVADVLKDAKARPGMADPAGERRAGGRHLELDRVVRAQGHPAADPGQAPYRDGEDSRLARRQGALRRRRLGHLVDHPGAARRPHQGRCRRIQEDRGKGQYPGRVSPNGRAPPRREAGPYDDASTGSVTMRIRSPKDFWSGLCFIAIAVAFMALATRYRFGTAEKMGPGFFPIMVGILQAGLGAILLGRSFVLDG